MDDVVQRVRVLRRRRTDSVPVSSSYSTTPNAKTSVRRSSGLPLDLLGRHVRGGADARRRRGDAGAGPSALGALGQLGDAEVDDLRARRRAVTMTLSGLRSRWTMPASCALRQTFRDLGHQLDALRDAVAPAHPLRQRLAVDELHGQKVHVAVRARVVDGDDGWMVERRRARAPRGRSARRGPDRRCGPSAGSSARRGGRAGVLGGVDLPMPPWRRREMISYRPTRVPAGTEPSALMPHSLYEVRRQKLDNAHSFIADSGELMSRIVKAGLIKPPSPRTSRNRSTPSATRRSSARSSTSSRPAREGVQMLCLQEIFNGPYFCAEQTHALVRLRRADPRRPDHPS